jgi:hypothetical protein
VSHVRIVWTISLVWSIIVILLIQYVQWFCCRYYDCDLVISGGQASSFHRSPDYYWFWHGLPDLIEDSNIFPQQLEYYQFLFGIARFHPGNHSDCLRISLLLPPSINPSTSVVMEGARGASGSGASRSPQTPTEASFMRRNEPYPTPMSGLAQGKSASKSGKYK